MKIQRVTWTLRRCRYTVNRSRWRTHPLIGWYNDRQKTSSRSVMEPTAAVWKHHSYLSMYGKVTKYGLDQKLILYHYSSCCSFHWGDHHHTHALSWSVAVSTSCFQCSRSCTYFHAQLKPKLWGWRSASRPSRVHSQVWQDVPEDASNPWVL